MELLGVTALCYFGGVSCIMKAEHKGTLVSVALCHMCILAGLIYVGAQTSGGHYNPAVTLGLFVTGKHDWWNTILYLIFQTVGSILAGLLLRYCIPKEYRAQGGLGYPTVDTAHSDMVRAFFAEVICTFTLVFMVFAMAVDKRATKLYMLCVSEVP